MPNAPVIACVKWGERYGPYYVNALHDMVRRNLPEGADFLFQCFTDDIAGLDAGIESRPLPGDLAGWWNKLHLFKEGIFAPGQRILYFDLDTVILGGIEALLRYAGDFALLRDFYRPQGYGSGVMLWRAEAGYPIWSQFEAAGRPLPEGGDQAWIETAMPEADRLQDVFPAMFASYKTDCHPLPPIGARVVCFHGEPKQDNCGAAWVAGLWKPGGAAHLLPGASYPAMPGPWLKEQPAHDRHAVIVGGGPTLPECREELQADVAQGYMVFAVGGSTLWLTQNNIRFGAHILGGASEEHAAFVPDEDMPCYYAATCPLSTLKRAGNRLVLWRPAKADTSTGLQAIALAHLLGYRRFHLYGFDSCYQVKTHHAYACPQEECNRRFAVELQGRRFLASAWMLRQAEKFFPLADTLIKEGCSFSIHGDGLLHFLATQAQRGVTSSGTAP